jgi:hypothetical protein
VRKRDRLDPVEGKMHKDQFVVCEARLWGEDRGREKGAEGRGGVVERLFVAPVVGVPQTDRN